MIDCSTRLPFTLIQSLNHVMPLNIVVKMVLIGNQPRYE